MIPRKWGMGAILALVLFLGCLTAAMAAIDTTFRDGDPEYPPDNHLVKPGAEIDKWWKPLCTGDRITNAYLKVVPNRWGLGSAGLIGPEKPILIESTKEGVDTGERFKVQVKVKVPKNLPDGKYEMDFKMCDSQGKDFSPGKKPLYILVEVKRQ